MMSLGRTCHMSRPLHVTGAASTCFHRIPQTPEVAVYYHNMCSTVKITFDMVWQVTSQRKGTGCYSTLERTYMETCNNPQAGRALLITPQGRCTLQSCVTSGRAVTGSSAIHEPSGSTISRTVPHVARCSILALADARYFACWRPFRRSGAAASVVSGDCIPRHVLRLGGEVVASLQPPS